MILSCGIVTTRFKNYENFLILFEDFLINKELVKKLEKIFSKVIIFQGAHSKDYKNYLKRLLQLNIDLKKINSINYNFENIFVVNDGNIEEQKIMKKYYLKNKNINFVYLEDGTDAYFNNSAISRGFGSSTTTKAIRKIIFEKIFLLDGFYHSDNLFGTHKLIKEVYCCFPKFLREELQIKVKNKIGYLELKNGILSVISQDKDSLLSHNGLVITLDLLSRYGERKEEIKARIEKFVSTFSENFSKIYIKYHPKEKEEINFNFNYLCLDKRIPFEAYLLNEKLTILGVASTTLQTAKIMGHEVFYIKLKNSEEKNKQIEFLNKIEIKEID